MYQTLKTKEVNIQLKRTEHKTLNPKYLLACCILKHVNNDGLEGVRFLQYY